MSRKSAQPKKRRRRRRRGEPAHDNAVIYARFSPRRNEDDCASIDVQFEESREYCVKHGYAVVACYSDEARSGDDIDRPGLWDAVNTCIDGHAQVVVVHRRDRLTRSVWIAETVRRQLAGVDARIEAANEGPSGGRPEDDMIRQILDVFAEYERKTIAARTKRAMQHHQANGRIMGSMPPYGWRKDPDEPKRMIPCPAEREMLSVMYELYNLDPERGFTSRVSAEMNRRGYRQRNGNPWTPPNVSKVVTRMLELHGDRHWTLDDVERTSPRGRVARGERALSEL